jgi:hypothetical protein
MRAASDTAPLVASAARTKDSCLLGIAREEDPEHDEVTHEPTRAACLTPPSRIGAAGPQVT